MTGQFPPLGKGAVSFDDPDWSPVELLVGSVVYLRQPAPDSEPSLIVMGHVTARKLALAILRLFPAKEGPAQ